MSVIIHPDLDHLDLADLVAVHVVDEWLPVDADSTPTIGLSPFGDEGSWLNYRNEGRAVAVSVSAVSMVRCRS